MGLGEITYEIKFFLNHFVNFHCLVTPISIDRLLSNPIFRSREGGTDSIWCLKSGLSGRKWGIWYPDNFPQIIRILGLLIISFILSQIRANSINIWLRYDPKTLSNNLLKSFSIHLKEIYIKNWFQFSDSGSSLRSFFTHMKEVHLEIWF